MRVKTVKETKTNFLKVIINIDTRPGHFNSYFLGLSFFYCLFVKNCAPHVIQVIQSVVIDMSCQTLLFCNRISLFLSSSSSLKELCMSFEWWQFVCKKIKYQITLLIILIGLENCCSKNITFDFTDLRNVKLLWLLLKFQKIISFKSYLLAYKNIVFCVP